MPRQAKKKTTRAKSPAKIEISPASPDQAPVEEAGQQSVQAVVLRMQAVLNERIDRTRETLRSTEEAMSSLRDYEARIGQLEAEVHGLRTSGKALEMRAKQQEAENTALRARLAAQPSASEVARLRQAVQQARKVAAEELGRAVKALLPRKGGLFWKGTSLSKQAQALVKGGVVDPAWYLAHHGDVAAAGMDPAVHYILHGAAEGRAPNPTLDEATRGD